MFKNIFLFLLLVIVWTIAGTYSGKDSSPQHSVDRLVEAIKQRNILTVRKYTDINLIISGLVDDLLDKTVADYQPKSDLEAVGKAIGIGMLDTLKPSIIASGKESVVNLIEKGVFEPKTTRKESQAISLAETWSRTEGIFKNYRGIEYTRKEGSSAFVGLKLYHHQYDESFTLELEMVDMDGYWKAVKLVNFLELHNRLIELQKAKAAKEKPASAGSS